MFLTIAFVPHIGVPITRIISNIRVLSFRFRNPFNNRVPAEGKNEQKHNKGYSFAGCSREIVITLDIHVMCALGQRDATSKICASTRSDWNREAASWRIAL